MDYDFEKWLTCERCGKTFKIFDRRQLNKKYCSERCKKAIEAERKRKIRANKDEEPKEKAKKKRTRGLPKTYRDPDTGAIYKVNNSDDKLVQIDKECKMTGLSYGEYTSKSYAPIIFNTFPVDKEKEYKRPQFVWKESKRRKKK